MFYPSEASPCWLRLGHMPERNERRCVVFMTFTKCCCLSILDNLFDAMDAVGGGPCMDDHDTDPHVSMARGVKFKSSYHQQK